MTTKRIEANGSRGHHRFILIVNEQDPKVLENYSPTNYQFILEPIQAGWDWYISGITYEVYIKAVTNNQETYLLRKTGNISGYDGRSQVQIDAGNLNIPHDDDGTKRITIGFNVTDSVGASYTPGNASASSTMDLTKIPRGSALNYVSGKDNADYEAIIVDDTSSKNRIKYTKNVSTYFNKLEISINANNKKELIKTITEAQGLTDNYVFSFTQDEINSIQQKTKDSNIGTTSDGYVNIGNFSFDLITYENSSMQKQVGAVSSVSRVARLTLAQTAPTLSATLEDKNDKTVKLTGNSKNLVRYASTVRVTPSYILKKGATLKSLTVNEYSLGSKNYVDIINSSATTYTIIVTDSRNISTTLTFQSSSSSGANYFKLINYVPLTLRADIDRHLPSDDKIKIDYSGNYYNGSFNSTANSLSISYRYKESGASSWSSWTSITPKITNNTYSQDYVSDALFDYNKIFDVEIQAVDKINTLVITGIKVKKGVPIANWNTEKFNVNGELTIKGTDLKSFLLELEHPVGSYYFSDYSTNPGTIFGGTWEQVKDLFLSAAGDNYKAGVVNGSDDHSHGSGTLKAAIGAVDGDARSIGYIATDPESNGSATYSITGASYKTGGSFNHYTRIFGSTDKAKNVPKNWPMYVFRRIK